jgi:hypothetical protein
MVEMASVLGLAVVLVYATMVAICTSLDGLGAMANKVDTSSQDRVVRQWIEREERGEPRPNGGPWFAPSYLEQWKKENDR